jgi:branched-chain amino acid transport system ATP-binding protein
MSKLQIRNLRTGYDKVDVLHDVSIDVAPGKITWIRSILGLTLPRAGQVLWDGADLTGEKTHRIIARGIACIPEGRKVFPRMSVEENLMLGAYLEKGGAQLRERIERVYEIFPRLRERARQFAGTMSGGEQAMVSIGRGLMAAPRLLLIDEPSLGLSPLFVKENFKVIKQINELGTTVLLVEQNAHQTLAISHYGYVLSQGRVVASGTAQQLADNNDVRAAYFA